MKKYNISIISIALLMIGNTSFTAPNFNNDSVTRPLISNNYNNLNGCPATLKVETKSESCPTGYTGIINYKRTLSSDAVKFGDSVSCEKGGKWSSWEEVSRSCVVIPKPTNPNDLLKTDSCDLFKVNGSNDNWYVFRKNSNQAFLKDNYDDAISSGMSSDDYYKDLTLNTNNEKTIAVNSNIGVSCNIQSNKSEANKSYNIETNTVSDKNARYLISTMNQNTVNKLKPSGLNNLTFNLNGKILYSNNNVDTTNLNIQSKLSDLSLSKINGISNLNITNFTVQNGKTINNINNINNMNISNIDFLGNNSIYINNIYKANYNSFVGDMNINNFVTNFDYNQFKANKYSATETYNSNLYINMRDVNTSQNYQIEFGDFFINDYRACVLTTYMVMGNRVGLSCNSISIW